MGRFALLENLSICNTETINIVSSVSTACVIKPGGERLVAELTNRVKIKQGDTLAFIPGAMVITLHSDS